MRFVKKENIRAGMVLASAIYSRDGNCMLNSNVRITNEYANRLQEMEISGIYIYDQLSADIHVEQALTRETIENIYNVTKRKDYDRCMFVAAALVNDLLAHIDDLPNVATLAAYDDTTFQHSINVAMYAAKLGIELGFTKEQLEQAAAAGLMHDIGKQGVDIGIIDKEGSLTPEEIELVRRHPTLGFEMMKDYISIPAVVKHAILCHHEDFDGNGYPNRYDFRSLRELDLVIHICDVYDALISKRSYKDAYSPNVALSFLMSKSGIMFKPEHVQSFLNCMFPYTTGMEVELSDGRHVVIKENYRGFPMCPDVITKRTMEVISLRDNTDLMITKIL